MVKLSSARFLPETRPWTLSPSQPDTPFPASSRPRPSGAPMPRARTRVLVIDDERTLTDVTVQMLGLWGYEARGAYDGRVGLEAARAFRPDIVLMDVLMPNLNGIDAAIALRSQMPQVKVLIISGQTGSVDLLDRARRQGYDFSLLPKPIEPEELRKKLEELASP